MPTPSSIRYSFGLSLIALAAAAAALAAQSGAQPQAASTLPPPAHLTSAQDHQREMDLLHIASLRRGADQNPNSPNATNYDEAKANPYPTLPDPLTLENGNKVKSAKVWWQKRRPEIVEYFDREVYGRVPANVPAVNWEVATRKKEITGGVPVITKEIRGHVDNSSYPLLNVEIYLSLSTPANATGPVPVMMALDITPEYAATMPRRP